MSMWRTKGKGKKARHIPVGGGTAFGPAENQSLAAEVRAGSVEDSRTSADDLERDFREAKTPAHKKEVWHATELEANRLDIDAHNMNNGPAERASLAERSRIFRAKADEMHAQLARGGYFETEAR